MFLSKSKYCEAFQCKKILWLDEHCQDEREETANSGTLDNGIEVGIIAKDLFGPHIDIEFNEDLETMIDDTKKALKGDNVVITEASFSYENNFCSVDILRKFDDGIEIYEIKSSTEIKDIYIEDISYQTYVLSKLGYNIKKACIVIINSSYVRNGDLDLNELFTIKDATEIASAKFPEVEMRLDEIERYMFAKDEPEKRLGLNCVTPYDCPFFKYCTKHIPENNVFKIRGMQARKKFELYNRNIITYEDLLKVDIGTKYRQQIEYEVEDLQPHIDLEAINEFLNTLSYPLYFLDFETYQQPIPKFDGVKPYMQIPFQYSLHVIDNDFNLTHKEFLGEADADPRRALAERLVSDIPMDVTTVAYNMMFEKMVIKNLAKLFPDLSKHLMNIHDNMKDLMVPFKERKFYNREMHGSYSIKYVLPALFPNEPELDYHNLDLIHNGSEAMESFANLGSLSQMEQQKVRYNLLKYCELDTYAMVKIWEKLLEITNQKIHIKKTNS